MGDLNIIKLKCGEAGIQGRKVNHSTRKTVITTLVHAGILPTLLHQHFGHNNLASIKNYRTVSINQQKGISGPLSNFLKGAKSESSEKISNGLHENNDSHVP